MKKTPPRPASAKAVAPAETIDAYLAALPKDARAALAKLRRTIRTSAPKAVESVTYRIPMFKHRGLLVGFAAFKDHCGFYVMSPAVMRAHAADVAGYELGKGTIRFPAIKPLPVALVRKLVKARVAENEARRRK